MNSENTFVFPNLFYDAIVFFTPSVLLTLGIVFGLRNYIDWHVLLEFNWGILNTVLIGVILWFLGYEYGSLASAWSSVIVQSPLKFIAHRTRFLNNPNFNARLVWQVKSLKLGIPKVDELGSKWTLYYFAMHVSPQLGADLLKRYAWEKLARSSAFTFFVLFIISIGVRILHWLNMWRYDFYTCGIGSWSYTFLMLFFVVLTYYEYYLRNCWNHDLLTKVLPVLCYVDEHSKKNKLEVSQ